MRRDRRVSDDDVSTQFGSRKLRRMSSKVRAFHTLHFTLLRTAWPGRHLMPRRSVQTMGEVAPYWSSDVYDLGPSQFDDGANDNGKGAAEYEEGYAVAVQHPQVRGGRLSPNCARSTTHWPHQHICNEGIAIPVWSSNAPLFAK